MDDPECIVAKSSKEGYHCLTPFNSRSLSMSESPSELATGQRIDNFLNESLVDRMRVIGGMDEAPSRGGGRCGWLYKSVSVDGLGRIMPCCDAPSQYKRLVFGNLKDKENDYWNSPDFTLSRLSLSDKKAFIQQSPDNASHCGTCAVESEPPHDLWRVAEDLPCLDKKRAVSDTSVKWLTRWRLNAIPAKVAQ
jgi:hypothetical protein